MAHDASATWSGFNYQGKVALYHSLKLIIQKVTNQETLDDFSLILENNEDFDILGPNGFESFHQVKAINQTAFNKFEDALFAMILQLDNPVHSNVNGFFHTWRPINWQGDNSFRQQLKSTAEKVLNDKANNPGNCIITKSLGNDANACKKTKIIRQAITDDNRLVSFADIDSVIQIIADANIPNSTIDRVTRYDYGNGALFCTIDKIDNLVKHKIEELQLVSNIATDNNATVKIFCQLLRLLDENVIRKHLGLNQGNLNPIPFSEIFNIVTNVAIRDSDEEFLASEFKLEFVTAFEEFLEDSELCPIEVAEEYLNGGSRLNKCMEILFSLSARELFEHYKNLSPQIEFEDSSYIMQALRIEPLNIKNYLFSIFSNLCDEKLEHNIEDRILNYLGHAGQYRPTTIGNDTKKHIVKKLMRSPHALIPLYETSALVSGDRNAPTIEDFEAEYSNQAQVDIEHFYQDEAPENKEKISQISKTIRLINIDTAIQEVNND